MNPDTNLQTAATALKAKDWIKVRESLAVRCVCEGDGDYAASDRLCAGVALISEDLESVACPDCGRDLYPAEDRKRLHKYWRIRLAWPGILRDVEQRLRELDPQVFVEREGAYRLSSGTYVCVADRCSGTKYVAQDWVALQPMLFLVADAPVLASVAPATLSLAGLWCDPAALPKALYEAGRRAPLPRHSPAMFSRGPQVTSAAPATKQAAPKTFVVEVSLDEILVQGISIMAPQAHARMHLFRVLWRSFLDSLQRGLSAEDHPPLNVSQLRKALKAAGVHSLDDEGSLRQTVNRLQRDIEGKIKSTLGHPLEREDIIETLRRSSRSDADFGYRINPQTVVARLFQSR